MSYLYEGHLGTLFTSPTVIELKECYCETCGDYDHLIGKFETLEEFWSIVKDYCSIDGSGGWSLQYIFPLMLSEFNIELELEYETYSDKAQGVCSNSDRDILSKIEQLIRGK